MTDTIPVAQSNVLTPEQFKRVLPPQLKKSINQELIDRINTTISDPILRESYRDNILGYVGVLQDGRFKIEDYVNAVRYCSYKLMGDSNIVAYTKAFPDRYQQFLTNGTSEKDIASYVSSYNKNKLVNLIMEQTMIPSHILNADMYQDALNVQARLMQESSSDKVRCDAANSLLTHLKPPETKKVELDIGLKQDKSIDQLRETILELGKSQRQMIEGGMSTAKDIAHSKVINVESEVIDVE